MASAVTEYFCKLLNASRPGSVGGIWSIGKTIAARGLCSLAAITHWPTPVAIATTARDISSNKNKRVALLTSSAISSSTTLPIKPLKFTTANARLIIVPAISPALGSIYARSTANVVGATTTLKNIAAPNQSASSRRRMSLVNVTILIVIADFGNESDLRRSNRWGRQFAWIGHGQQP